jgi:hypothetical protein
MAAVTRKDFDNEIQKLDSIHKVDIKKLNDSLNFYKGDIKECKTEFRIDVKKYEAAYDIYKDSFYVIYTIIGIVLAIGLAIGLTGFYHYIKSQVKKAVDEKLKAEINYNLAKFDKNLIKIQLKNQTQFRDNFFIIINIQISCLEMIVQLNKDVQPIITREFFENFRAKNSQVTTNYYNFLIEEYKSSMSKEENYLDIRLLILDYLLKFSDKTMFEEFEIKLVLSLKEDPKITEDEIKLIDKIIKTMSAPKP